MVTKESATNHRLDPKTNMDVYRWETSCSLVDSHCNRIFLDAWSEERHHHHMPTTQIQKIRVEYGRGTDDYGFESVVFHHARLETGIGTCVIRLPLTNQHDRLCLVFPSLTLPIL
jgi:hypothetical protein